MTNNLFATDPKNDMQLLGNMLQPCSCWPSHDACLQHGHSREASFDAETHPTEITFDCFG